MCISEDALRKMIAQIEYRRARDEFSRETIMRAYVELYHYLMEHR